MVLTTRELAKLIRYEGLNPVNLPESDFDSPLGTGSGAGAIFGATGGVMEAALRTAYELYTKKGTALPGVRGKSAARWAASREATIDLDGTPLKVAVVNGLKNAEGGHPPDSERRGRLSLRRDHGLSRHGCIGGGGQPIGNQQRKRKARIKALYDLDKSLPLRKSHENPGYPDHLSGVLRSSAQPQGPHELLHTEYFPGPSAMTSLPTLRSTGSSCLTRRKVIKIPGSRGFRDFSEIPPPPLPLRGLVIIMSAETRRGPAGPILYICEKRNVHGIPCQQKEKASPSRPWAKTWARHAIATHFVTVGDKLYRPDGAVCQVRLSGGTSSP